MHIDCKLRYKDWWMS